MVFRGLRDEFIPSVREGRGGRGDDFGGHESERGGCLGVLGVGKEMGEGKARGRKKKGVWLKLQIVNEEGSWFEASIAKRRMDGMFIKNLYHTHPASSLSSLITAHLQK